MRVDTLLERSVWYGAQPNGMLAFFNPGGVLEHMSALSAGWPSCLRRGNMMDGFSTEVIVKQTARDGWHLYTCDLLPGLFVASQDDRTAYNDVPQSIQRVTFLSGSGQSICARSRPNQGTPSKYTICSPRQSQQRKRLPFCPDWGASISTRNQRCIQVFFPLSFFGVGIFF